MVSTLSLKGGIRAGEEKAKVYSVTNKTRAIFILFIEKMFAKNLPIVPEQYRVDFENLSQKGAQLIKIAQELSERTQKDLDEGKKISFENIDKNIYRIHLKPLIGS